MATQKRKTPPKKPSKLATKPRKNPLRADDFIKKREEQGFVSWSGWTAEDIMSAVDEMDRGQFAQAELLYRAALKDSRIGPGLASRANFVRNFPFSLKVRRDAPQRLKDAAEQLQENWTECLSDTDRIEVVRRTLMFGFCWAKVTWTLRDGQQIFTLDPWTHGSIQYDYQSRCFKARDEDGKELTLVDDGQEWVLFTTGGEEPWLNGLLRILARLLFLEALLLDLWAAHCDTARGVKALKTPAIKRESKEVEALWEIVDKLRAGDTILLPEGFDLKLIESSPNSHVSIKDFLAWVDRSIGISLLGHEFSQGSNGGQATYGATSAALSVSRELSVSDVGYLAAPLSKGPLRVWVRCNFNPDLYKDLPRPLVSYAPQAFWDTREPEDTAKTADASLKNAQAAKTFVEAAVAAGKPVTSLPVDWESLARKCGLPMLDVGSESTPASKE